MQKDLKEDPSKLSKWDLIKFKLAQQKESRRQFLLYNLLPVCFNFHMNTKIFDSSWTDRSEVLYFYVGTDFCGVAVAYILLDIDFVVGMPHIMLYCFIQYVYTYYNF
jgi:hypothetical protein